MMMTTSERLENWGRWANDHTGTEYRGALTERKFNYCFSNDEITDAEIVDRAVAASKAECADYPKYLKLYYMHGKSYQGVYDALLSEYRYKLQRGEDATKPPSVSTIQIIIRVATGCIGGILLTTADKAA